MIFQKICIKKVSVPKNLRFICYFSLLVYYVYPASYLNQNTRLQWILKLLSFFAGRRKVFSPIILDVKAAMGDIFDGLASSARIPDPNRDLVFKDECFYSFDW